MNHLYIIRREGGSRVVSMTKILPKTWQAIEIEKVKETKRTLTLIIKRLR